MQEIHLAGWTISVDVERTRATYASLQRGHSEACGCDACLNFGTVVQAAFPRPVVEFFHRAGMDLLKDAEVYEMAETAPGVHLYGGEYYLWGKIIRQATGELQESPRFRFVFCSPTPLIPDEFCEEGALCFMFDAELPWGGRSSAS